jgi:membrane protein YqaA with SNARE-associated domain
VVPFGIDALVIVLAAGYGELFWIFLPLVTAVSVGGAAFTYWIGRTAGDAGLPRLVPPQHLERIKARLDRTGTGALAVAAVLPPPFPLTPVLLTCGALNLNRWKLLMVFGTMRLIRFGTVALLTRHYGEQFLQMIDADVFHTAVRSLMLVALGAISVAAAVVWSRTRPQTI